MKLLLNIDQLILFSFFLIQPLRRPLSYTYLRRSFSEIETISKTFKKKLAKKCHKKS